MRRTICRFFALAALTSLIVVLYPGSIYAQWTQTNGPKGGSIRSFVTVPNGTGGTSLYTGQIRVWRTDDNAASWTHLGNGIGDPNAFALLAVPNGSGGNDILVSTANGIYRSANNGVSWTASSSGIPANLSIYSLASGPNGSGGTNLYAGAFLGDAYRSTNNGASWTAINSGLPLGQANVNALTTTAPGTVLAGTNNGIYRSTNYGGGWTRVLTNYAFSFAKHGTTLYTGTSSGVWRSTNDGLTWTAINTGMGFTWVYAVAAIPNGPGVTLFASAGGVFRSTDNGATWVPVNNGLTNLSVYALTTVPNASSGTDLYAGTSEGIFRTSNNGDNWANVSFVYSNVQGLEVTPSGAILAGTENDIFRSSDGGVTWTDTPIGAPTLDFAINPNGSHGGVSLFASGAIAGIFRSIDDGATWTGLFIDDPEVNSLAAVPNGSGGTNMIAGTYSGIFLSTNDGESWQSVEPNAMPLDYVVVPNGSGGHTIFGGGFGGVWRSTNFGLTWTVTQLSGMPQGMAATANGTNVFAGGDPFGVYRSTDSGATWQLVNNGLTDLRIMALLSPDGTHLFAAGGGGVFLSSDNGNNWTSVSTGLTTGVFSLSVSADGSTLLAGTTGYGVWKRPLSQMIGVTGVGPDVRVDRRLEISPNPLRGGGMASIAVQLAPNGQGRLEAYDVSGRRVRSWDLSGTPNAREEIRWDGKSQAGTDLAPGVYFLHLVTGQGSVGQRILMVR